MIRTPDQRLRVFVSSTLQELTEERAAAQEAIADLRLAPVMFELGARPHPPRDVYRAYLDQSHIFVGIYWQKYGWVAPGESISGLEDEYRLAGDRPKLIYIKMPAPDREPRLKELLSDIKGQDAVSYKYFSTAGELRELVANDLALLLTERFEAKTAVPAKPLPGGTVTFFFTDVENSTRLWEEHPEAMRQALIRYDALVARNVEQSDGVLVRGRGEGDSHFAVFTRASDAVAAAGALQQALFAEAWPAPIVLRTRAALNSGEADLREGDYYGTAVNRCARLRAIAHGGQTLLSQATVNMVRDSLPEGVELRDLGLVPLTGLSGQEHVYQVVVAGAPADFPPLKAAETRRGNLPTPRNPLIDRDDEVKTGRALLLQEGAGLVTLTGPGGSGKSRLALYLALDLRDELKDGAFLVSLAPIRDPGLVAYAIAQTLGVRETAGGRSLVESIKDYLRDKDMLLLLDNFEQVVSGAPLVGELLEACPRLKVLVTSRVPLRLRSERELPVPPLTLPGRGQLSDLESLSQCGAVELFTQRAKAVNPDFALTGENASAVVEICYRLDGLPLAIELAAARIKMLPPQALLSRLAKRLDMLRGGARDLPERQQTLRSAIEWSYDLLSEDVKKLFRRLSVFVGGWTLEAAEAVCNADGALGIDVLDELEALVDNSLLKQSAGEGGEPRFRMLETIGEYALERLVESAEEEIIRRRHARYFSELAESAEPHLTSGRRAAWLNRLEVEHDNLRAALAWSQVETVDPEVGLRLAGALGWFWFFRSYLSEGRAWLSKALARTSTSTHTATWGKALYTLGGLAWAQGDSETARAHLDESLAISRELGPAGRQSTAYALTLLGFVAISLGEPDAAHRYSRESLDILRQVGAPWLEAFTFRGMGDATLMLGDQLTARSLFEEGLTKFRALEDAWGISMMLNSLAGMALAEDDYATAHARYGESATLLRGVGNKWGLGVALIGLGYAALHQGDLRQTQALFKESLALWRELGSEAGIVMSLAGFAAMATAQAAPQRAVRLFGAVDVLSEASGFLSYGAGRREFDRNLAAARAQLDAATFEAAWAEGRALQLEQAIDYVLEKQAGV